MENPQETQIYKSHDFYLSAICLAVGLSLIRLERGRDKFVTFVFSDPQNNANQIISDHWNRKCRVPSRDIIEAINELKTRMYNKVSQSDG